MEMRENLAFHIQLKITNLLRVALIFLMASILITLVVKSVDVYVYSARYTRAASRDCRRHGCAATLALIATMPNHARPL